MDNYLTKLKLVLTLSFMLLVSVAFQVNAQIRGTVRDSSTKETIPGVTIQVKGTSSGVSTDLNGNFTLPNSNQVPLTLVVSSVGYRTREVGITSIANVNILLVSTQKSLSEVVVVGYGVQKRSDVTGSISSVKGTDLTKTAVTGLDQALQGRASGVNISANTGSPGSAATVRIRGVGTVGNSDPLYVVDGVPINNITTLNMNDVESVDILKDASATAIYGSRGANGVILIKTKSGKAGKTSISYNGYYGSQHRWRKLDELEGPTWASLINEEATNDGTTPRAELANPGSLPTYNWADLAYRTGSIQDHQLSVSGGADKSTYYLSYENLAQKGIVGGTSYNRQSFRANNSYNLTKFLEVGGNLSYATGQRSNVPENGGNPNLRAPFIGYTIEPITPIYKADGTYNVSAYNNFTNPLSLIQYNTQTRNPTNFSGNLYLNLKVNDFTFRSVYGLIIDQLAYDNFGVAYFTSANDLRTPNVYTLRRDRQQNQVWTNTLNYNHTFKKHTFSALLGFETQDNKGDFILGTRSNIPTSIGNPTLGAGDATTATNDGTPSESKLLSYFSRVNYNYDNRYLLTANFRIDGSSKFGPNKRYGAFPSIGLGWNVHNEKFFKVSFIDQLKVRLGYGEIGNQNIPNYGYFNIVSTSPSYVFGSPETVNVAVAPYTNGNPDLQWETTVTKNIGLDLGLFKNSLTLSADYYIKNTTKLILALPQLATAGYENASLTNAGNIENKGLELLANYQNHLGQVKFNVGGNISFVNNKVLNLGTAGNYILSGQALGYTTTSRTQVGYPIAQFYGYVFDGLFQNSQEVTQGPVLANNTITKAGDARYKDISGPNGIPDGIINDFDKTFIGNPLPKFTYGFNIGANYKSFDFSAFFQGSYGNKIFSADSYVLEGGSGLSNLTSNIIGRWTGPGTGNTIPRMTLTNAASNFAESSRLIRDGSYLRLKNVQLGYTFSKEKLQKLFVQNFRIYVGSENLFTITKYIYGLDPEIGVGRDPNNGISNNISDPLDIGVDRGVYPQARTFLFGVNLSL